jgi:hypothetical protein
VHGKNARVSNNGVTASRPRAFGEFNDAIVISNRALREGEMFEVVIEKMVDRWSGSIEAGERLYLPRVLINTAVVDVQEFIKQKVYEKASVTLPTCILSCFPLNVTQ